jgi:hypothetical protein
MGYKRVGDGVKVRMGYRKRGGSERFERAFGEIGAIWVVHEKLLEKNDADQLLHLLKTEPIPTQFSF